MSDNKINRLHAVSSVDGRYAGKTEPLAEIFSEFGLIKRRVKVEIAWLIYLCRLLPLPKNDGFDKGTTVRWLESLSSDMLSDEDALRIKEIEKTTNHDVKAVEYFLQEKLNDTRYKFLVPFIHFGLTSEDTDNLARSWQLYDGMCVLLDAQDKVMTAIEDFAQKYKKLPMLGLTHGQPASPTTFGKEMLVFSERLGRQMAQLGNTIFLAKIGGATGTLAALYVTYPKIDWEHEIDSFITQDFMSMMDRRDDFNITFEYNRYTTQVESKDVYAEIFQNISRVNVILTGFCQDIWGYISREWIKQLPKEGEVGSSTMPHKVNPIDFENAEGNLGLANGNFEFLCRKLPISRFQRDLSDSTVQRTFGTTFGYCLIAYESILKGLGKISVNDEKILADLDTHWEILAEPIQMILRREDFATSYEMLKGLTRGNKTITKQSLHAFIETLNVTNVVRDEMRALTPRNYIGNAASRVGIPISSD